jgi:S-methylmethionine-dependent homocysteine/selenocysteine methylase
MVFALSAASLVEAGASFVGGCCGTSPAFVAAIRSALARSTLVGSARPPYADR